MNLITQNLNPRQLEAVETLNGPLLLLAGAGSGKTRVLTHRIANLITHGLAEPQNILAVTFTNKAAKEMRERTLTLLQKLNIYPSQPPWIATFHSFCVQVLRAYIHTLDYSPNFTIYDRADQLALIKKIFKQINLDSKTYSAKTFLSTINTSKIYGISPDDLMKEAENNIDKKTAEVYALYESQMKEANALDFDDLLIKTILIFKTNPEVLEFYQSELKYLMVDEYQDTSLIQYELIHLLSKKHRNLCAVGDEDQSIYSWRGANIENILNFEKDYPEAITIKLEENYRSTKTIVNAASEVIKNNTLRKEKTLFTSNQEGEKILVQEVQSEYDEGKFVAQNIQNIMKDGAYSYDDVAVFYRANSQSRAIEEELRSYQIPYQIIGGVRFYDRMEVKDLICYLRLVLNDNDDVSFMRVYNTPTRGIGNVTLSKILDYSKEHGLSLMKASQEIIDHNVFNAGVLKKLQSFVHVIQYLRAQIEFQKPSEFLKTMTDHLQYVEYLKFEKPDDYPQRLDNLNELTNVLVKFEKERGADANMTQFLEEISLVSDIDELEENQHSVKLMTLHVSKGLEYPFVFIVGFEDGMFPSGQSIESMDLSLLEEERRLCYVGMTRAKEKLFLSYAKRRMQWGQEMINPPSRFLNEIPARYTEQVIIRRPLNHMLRDQDSLRKNMSRDPFPDYDHSSSFREFDSPEDESSTSFKKGMRVRHPAYGIGTIYQLEGSGESQKVTILFPNHNLKKFIIKFARLERV